MLRKRSRYIVVAAIVVAFAAGFWAGKYLFEPVEESIPSEYFHQMTLLTWRGWSGELCFLLLPMMQRGRATHDFWSKWSGQCGIPKLKEALSAVPPDQYVYWNDWPGKFTYPEDHVVREIIEFAKGKGVRLEESPALQ
jgi:hypothetical protein